MLKFSYQQFNTNLMNNPKVVLITGAARRVGAEMVRHLHQSGLNIVLHYRSSSKDASELAELLNAEPVSYTHLTLPTTPYV